MTVIQKISLSYLVGLVLIALGFGIGRYGLFPARYIDEFAAFVRGDDLAVETTVIEKLENDVGLVPTRSLRTFPAEAPHGGTALEIPGLKSRRERPTVYLAHGQTSGYRVVFGAFDFRDAFWGGVLLGPNGDVLHTWKLSSEAISDVPDELKFMYGVHVGADGSVIFSQQEPARGIVKVDACSKLEWYIPGFFHHTITATGDGSFWTFAGRQSDFDPVLARYSIEAGQPEVGISMADVRARNPLVHVWNLQRSATSADFDISHANDIEPLSAALADRFPQFEAGDLLVSYRTQNLVFVLDPDTLEVKWWRIGAWDRQHDPDWEPDGTIAVFSNNSTDDRQYSDIVAIDPTTMRQWLLVDGERYGFYSEVNGDQELTEFGTRMITSASQGWVFEVDEKGKVVFSFVNTYDAGDNSALVVSEADRLPEDYFEPEFWDRCPLSE